jgi:hypothetical protein
MGRDQGWLVLWLHPLFFNAHLSQEKGRGWRIARLKVHCVTKSVVATKENLHQVFYKYTTSYLANYIFYIKLQKAVKTKTTMNNIIHNTQH